MFEAAELGRKVSKAAFAEREPSLRTALLTTQRELVETGAFPVLVIVSGVEGAGKGTLVDQLYKWLDARGLRTAAFWNPSDEERERPRYWRFWRHLPAKGSIGIFFGSWYTDPIIERVYRRLGAAAYERELRRCAAHERLLVADGMLIVKFWLHLPESVQRRRLEADVERGLAPSPLLKRFAKRYDAFVKVSERAIRLTDTGPAPWHVVEATDPRYRDLAVGEHLLGALRERLRRPAPALEPGPAPAAANGPTVLDRVDLGRRVEDKPYEKRLARRQRALSGLAWRAQAAGIDTVAVFEGWDAAGKGGAIRRLTQAIDARLYQVISVAAPTDEERAHHYLWRFWRHIPRAGTMTFYDRSWYGRVLVERVEGFARIAEWRRAYQEINDFEEQLVEHGVVLLKFWLHLSPDEQLARFRERESVAWKQHKITAEDWRNRERWDAYAAAVDEMVTRTSTAFAPWTLVSAEDKRNGRLEVLSTFQDTLAGALS